MSTHPSVPERPRLLLVDDEPAIREHLGGFLGRSGFEVDFAVDGDDALTRILTSPPHLVVLDVLMPGLDGREVLRRIRARDDWLPVILLTSLRDLPERVQALNEGADDYLDKPFDPQELLARIRGVLRRSEAGRRPLTAVSTLRSGELELDRPARRLRVGGREVALTPKAFALLDFLLTHPGELLTRAALLERVWGFESAVTTRAVDHRIAEIRRAIDDDPQCPRWIETVPGLGYRLLAEVTAR